MSAQLSWLQKISKQLDDMKESQQKTVNILTKLTSVMVGQDTQNVNIQDNIGYVSKFVNSLQMEREERNIEKGAYDFRRKYIYLWKKTLNDRKLAYYNKIRCQSTASIFEGFLERDPVFIPNKFKETLLITDSQMVVDRKMEMNIQKMKNEIASLKEKAIKYSSIIDSCETTIQTEIISKCDAHKVCQKLTEIWLADVSREEVKSKVLWSKTESWWKDLPNKPPVNGNNKEVYHQRGRQDNLNSRRPDREIFSQQQTSTLPTYQTQTVHNDRRGQQQQPRRMNIARQPSRNDGFRQNPRTYERQQPNRSGNLVNEERNRSSYPTPQRQEKERNFYEEPEYKDNFRAWSRNRHQRGDYYPSYNTRRNFLDEGYNADFPPLTSQR